MAVAHDAQTRFPATDTTGLDTTTGDRTFSHAGSASATGVVVVVCADATAACVTGVLYGGVDMLLSKSHTDTTEAGQVRVYTLMPGPPQGTQTVTLQGCTAAAKYAVCSTLTGGALEVNNVGGGDTNVSTNPLCTLGTTTADSLIYGGVHGGLAAPASYVAGTGYTRQFDADYGQRSSATQRRTAVVAPGSITYTFTAALDDWCIAAVAIALAAVFDQDSYRFRNDDGSETTATWRQAVNTPDTIALNTSFRLRIAFEETNGGDPINQQFSCEYRRKPSGGSFGSWVDVAAGVHCQQVLSSNFTNADPTTRQIWGSATNFAAGLIMEAGTASGDYAAGAQTEREWSLKLVSASGAAVDDTYEFRVRGASVFSTYTNTPSLTVAAAAAAARPRSPTVIGQAVKRAATWMRRDGLWIPERPELWVPDVAVI